MLLLHNVIYISEAKMRKNYNVLVALVKSFFFGDSWSIRALAWNGLTL